MKRFTPSPFLILVLPFLGAPDRVHAAGATVPFVSYEAESGTLGGGATRVSLTTAPTTQYSSPELEASGHAYVRLDATGEYVEWTNTTGKNITAFNIRTCIPDAPAGYGITATLDVFVNGAYRQSITLNSEQTWGYEGNDHYNNESQNPADGNPRTFYDDFRAFVTGAPVAPGDKIRLQKTESNTASFYYIDVIDVEQPPAPLSQPANSLSITTYGAVANDPNTDNTSAIQNCINAAQSQKKSVWIPQGTFYFKSLGGLNANGIAIEGAGMWYSKIYRNVPLPNNTPLGAIFNVTSCTVRNFSLDSNARSRASVDGCGGGMDTTGTNWLAENIWTQHTMSGFWASGTGGIVRNCRLISIWADGCNVNNVALTGSVGKNLTVANNYVRGTGDDAIAINSVDYNGTTFYTPMTDVTVINNTSVAMWGGKGVSIYGGSRHLVQNNYMQDTARYIGLGVGKFGANGSNLTSATVIGNVVVRCGGNAYVQRQPALHVGNGGDGHSTGSVGGAVVMWNTVIDSLYNGVGFSTSDNILFQNNTVTNPGRDGIVISPDFYPAPTGSATIANNTVTGLRSGRTAYQNRSSAYVATVTANSWQGGSTSPLPATPPAAPANISATVATTQVSLAWPPVPRADSYTVRRAASPEGPYTTLAANSIGTTYTDSALTAGAQYYYIVTASNSHGDSADSAGVTVLPYAINAVASANSDNPPNETAAQAFDGNTNTKWFRPNGNTGWLRYYFGGLARTVIRYDLTSGNDQPTRDPRSWQFQGSHDGSNWTTLDTRTNQSFSGRRVTLQYPVSNPTAYEYYRLNITANNGATAIQLAELTFTFSSAAPPTGLAATASNSLLSLSWNPVSGATGYQVRRATTPEGPYTDLPVATSTSLADTGLANGTKYHYVIATITGETIGENSTAIAATPQPNPPAAPASIIATAGDDKVTLAWTASPGATSYFVRRATSPDGPFTTIATLSSPGYADTAVDNRTTYYYVVTAANSGGQSETTPKSNATPLTQLDAWRVAHFTTLDNPNASLTADPDSDGIENLVEYAINTSPVVANPAPPTIAETSPDGAHLIITFSRIFDPALTYQVSAAGSMTGQWSSIWTSTGPQNTPGPVTVEDPSLISDQPARFLRLEVSTSQDN